MPSRINNYPAIVSRLSTARMNAASTVFNLQNDQQKYGFNLWAQHAAASLYPLIQQFEVLLRNSIDFAARKRFGDYWWEKIEDQGYLNTYKFRENIKKAIYAWKQKWKKQNPSHQGKPPEPSHDDIVAATDLSTWEFILYETYSTNEQSNHAKFLWPLSLTKAFSKLHVIDKNPEEARKKLKNLIQEVRYYRNRLFHHDCIWLKKNGNDKQSAIDSIREKINLIEKIITSIHRPTSQALANWRVFDNARRVCSISELDMFIYPSAAQDVDESDEPTFKKYLALNNDGNESLPISFQKNIYVLYRLR